MKIGRLVVGLCLTFSAAAIALHALTNESIEQMALARLGDDVVVSLTQNLGPLAEWKSELPSLLAQLRTSPSLGGLVDYGLRVLGVFHPGAIVQACALGAGNFEGESDDRGSDARAAGSRDRLFDVHALGNEYLMELFRGL